MSQAQRLLFVADGGPDIGLGHLSRCLALAHTLRDDPDIRFHISFLSQAPADWLRQQLASLSADCIARGADLDAALAQHIRPGDLVVCDGYHITLAHQRCILDGGGRLIVIDDFAQGPFAADYVVNTAPGLEAARYTGTAPDYTRLLLGPAYALVRPPFDAPASTDASRSGILVSLGGADAPNHTARLARALAPLGQPLTLLVGPANPHAEALASLALPVETRIRRQLSASDLHSALLECAVAVTSASVSAHEAAAAGAPLVVVQTALNQALLYRGLIGSGLALGADSPEATDTLVQHARHLLSSQNARAQMQAAQRATYDGGYSQRWREALADLYQQGIWLRRATADDAQRLFDWANDPLTRANSYRSEPIAMADHVAWLDRRLADPHTTLWIVMAGAEPIGQIRLQRNVDSRESTLSVGLAPTARGRGYAAPALARATQAYGARHPGETIHATIKLGNAASVRAFERAGFTFLADTTVDRQPSHHCIFVP